MKPSVFISTILIIALAGALSAGDISGTVKAKGTRHSGDAVIYIDKIEGKTFSPPSEKTLMDQKGMEFVPHVLPVLAGTTIEFLNNDHVLHNAFTPAKCAEKFNLGTWPKGEKRHYTFKEAGCVSVILCSVHPEMEAYIVVTPTPYFAVSQKSGKYEIKTDEVSHLKRRRK